MEMQKANAVNGQASTKVRLDKVKPDLMRSTLKALGMTDKGVANLGDAGLAEALDEHYRKLPKNQLVECDDCGGVSDMNLDACPYCGMGDGAEPGDTPAQAEPAGTGEKEDAVDTEAAGKKGKKGKKGSAKANGASTALAKVADAPLAGVTVKALDRAVAEVMVLKSKASGTIWQLGRKLAEIHEQQLWKARRIVEGEKETDAYKSWNQFCVAELNITPTTAYQYIDISKAFSEEQTSEYGKEKLAIIVRAPEEMQARLLEVAKTHGKRELQHRVTEAKAAAKTKKRATGRKPMPAGVPGAKGAKVNLDRITVASILRTYTVKMFKRPDDAKAEPSVPAKKLGDKPVGYIDLENKVRVWITWGEAKDGSSLVTKLILKRAGE